MTGKHNFTFRVRVQGLKGQLHSSQSKLFLSISVLSMLWSKQVLFLITFSFRRYFTFLTRSTSQRAWTLIVKRLFKRLFLRHSASFTLLWKVAHVYCDKLRSSFFWAKSRFSYCCMQPDVNWGALDYQTIFKNCFFYDFLYFSKKGDAQWYMWSGSYN